VLYGSSGHDILAGGHSPNLPGYHRAPTIVADIADTARLVTEEQFGPILPVLKYTEVDDAVARANNTRMGLCASVWTKDVEKGEAVAARLEAGTVWCQPSSRLGSRCPVRRLQGVRPGPRARHHGRAKLHGASGDQCARGLTSAVPEALEGLATQRAQQQRSPKIGDARLSILRHKRFSYLS
jgi:Aldehyde dehydrogenase family